jgi:hypothetical protein
MASSKVINNATDSLITRSQATELVDFYNNCRYSVEVFKNMCQKSDIIDNIPLNAINDTIIQLFTVIHHLKTYVYIRDLPDIKEYNDLNITLPPGKNTVKMLHYAMDNYIYIRDKCNYDVGEDMTDCFIEETICGICQRLRNGEFYFSTMYGLNVPICNVCIINSNYQSVDETKKDVNYVASEEEEDEEENEEDGVETEEDPFDEDDEDDEDYVESDEESESDEDGVEGEDPLDESDEDESDEDGVEGEDPLDESDEDESDEDGVKASETDEDPLDESDEDGVKASETDEDPLDESDEDGVKASETDEDLIDEEDAETLYLNGWEDGWNAAMKNIAKKAKNTEVKYPSRCSYCGTLLHVLKSCAGSCGGIVRYCSSECQKKHWYEAHCYDCQKL